ncbi:Rad51 domain-containing protein [Meloidogyne graminicola]|uniref:Rad51 domain-containing protein n=1 Tax=Meloidogyne graminicola TaxID=189291 RepID=A0A8S9ZDE6_9BILA|nr:Rad51 domain-containing protein [Meloidogyne graminicola]
MNINSKFNLQEKQLIVEENALDWLKRLNFDGLFFQTGHKCFDDLKIIISGEIVEIVGVDASGKMQLGMTIIAELLLSKWKRNWKVIVIDFNGSFRIGRLEQILKHKMLSNSIKLDINDLLKRINYGMAKSSCELKSRLLEIEFELKNNSFIPVIFINKIGSILFDATGKENINGQIQKQILLIFNEFCHKYGATIIITNHLVNWLGISKPALGKIWIKGISKRIFFKKRTKLFLFRISN